MNIIKYIFIYILFLQYVFSQARTKSARTKSAAFVVIEPYLPKLYTWNYCTKKYIPILNKNGKPTKNYPGGIYLQKFYRQSTTPRYEPVHKAKGVNMKRPRVPKRRTKNNNNYAIITSEL
jgi:hypothetical protein